MQTIGGLSDTLSLFKSCMKSVQIGLRIHKAFPKQANMVELEVGANKPPASLTSGNKILTVEFFNNIEFDLQLTPIIFILNL